jgi:hypothetical protein
MLFLIVLVYVVGVVFDFVLFGLNWVGRVKHPDLFRERSVWWLWLERKVGKRLAVFSILPIDISILTVWFLTSVVLEEMSVVLGVFVGFIVLNTMIDVRVVRSGFRSLEQR